MPVVTLESLQKELEKIKRQLNYVTAIVYSSTTTTTLP